MRSTPRAPRPRPTRPRWRPPRRRHRVRRARPRPTSPAPTAPAPSRWRGWGTTPPSAPTTAAPPAVPVRRPHGRRVVRVVRRVQLWSVFKVALLSFLVFYGIALLSAAAVWSLANSTGQVHHVEKFMRDIGFDNW